LYNIAVFEHFFFKIYNNVTKRTVNQFNAINFA